ncbi:SurA N-terminal domain-containing protein [Vreelandella rituensis]|uniref:Periplasmic chaperone PpiD n=1 Tax=Vreelandella rituensis TaxID=2282306 RepID=A0A368U8R4_9GAMM|nr:SurA N-terminal domain-containing protein [Halomonas rituensis]RCV93344.1 peptidylprolyl isomerase [Halomonas rituensis]
MLQSIRDRSRSWGAKIIIGVVVAAMALFGVESLFGLFGSDPEEVASVNGQPIMRQQVELEVQRALRSGQVPPEQERELRNQVLNQLITERLLRQYAEEGGLHVSDEQLDQLIVSLPEFQDQSGRFSQELFRNRLASAGYTPLSFRDELRVDIKRQQLQQGLAFSEFSLSSEQERLAELQRQQRSFRYVTLTPEQLEETPSVSEADLQAYYQDNAELFQRPEQVRLAYVLIDREAMAEDIEVSEEQLRRAWREQTADADRRVSHVMVTFNDERNREQALEKIETAREQLAEGESFSDVAARHSDDTTTAENGGDLGIISRGFFGDAFDEAAFGLDEGEVSDVVEMDGALHLLKVTELERPAFETMRETLHRELALGQVRDDFNQKVQRLIDESFAADDLTSVADDLGLTLHESEWLARNEGEGVLSEPGVMEEAFSEDVLEEGYNSEVIELDEDRRMVLRVAEHRDATQLPLEDVRSEVHEAVSVEKQQQALREQAEAHIKALRQGESLSLDWQQVEDVGRQTDSQVPQAVIQAAFRMARPEQGESRYAHVEMPSGVAVIALESVSTGDVDEQVETFVSQMAEQLRAQGVIQGLLDDLRREADIERR